VKIIIAGAGKVGYHLAKTLSLYHEITIIDKNFEAISTIQDDLDVLAICGDVESPKIYAQCMKKVDFFVAVTNSDEVNMIASLIIDDTIEVDKKIIRLKNSFFLESKIFEKLNIYATVFSSYHVASTLKRLLEFPLANNVKEFNMANFIMLSVRVCNPDYVGYNIREICKEFDDVVAIVGLERDKHFTVPKPSEVVKREDLLYIVGNKEIIKRRYANLEAPQKKEKKLENCIVFGANRVGVEMAKVLLDYGLEVKIIEQNLDLCEQASEVLQGEAIVLNSKYGWGHLLKEEGLDSADMVIASTTNDEYNMIKSIEAKEVGISKVIAINNDREYYSLMHALGLVVIRGEKIDTYYSILEQINADSLIVQKRYCGGRGVVLLKEISSDSRSLNRVIKLPSKIKECCDGYIIRENNILSEIENISPQVGDKLILFARSDYADTLEKWIYQAV
jgi:trk system potassium uptake protein TrkA